MTFKKFLILIMVGFLFVQINFLTAQEEEEPVQARKAWMSLKNSRSLKVLKVSKLSKELCRIELNDIKVLLKKSGITVPTTVYLRSKNGKIIGKLGVFNPIVPDNGGAGRSKNLKKGSKSLVPDSTGNRSTRFKKKGTKSLVPDSTGNRSLKFRGPGMAKIQIKKFDIPLLFENNSKRDLARQKKFNNYSLVFKNSKGITKGLLDIAIIVVDG